MNIDPLVPAKIFAGLKLKSRNAKSPPTRAAVIMPIGGWFTSGLRLKKKIVKAHMIETPLLTPSIPSNQFMAFIMKTIQMTAIRNPMQYPTAPLNKNISPNGLLIYVSLAPMEYMNVTMVT